MQRPGRLTVSAGSEIWVAEIVPDTARISRIGDDMVVSVDLADLSAPGGVRTAVLRLPFVGWVDAIGQGLMSKRGQRA